MTIQVSLPFVKGGFEMDKKIKEIISQMTLEDKIKLCSGATFWESEKMEQYDIPSFFMSDGPHGLRTQKGEADHLGINNSEESTCFPAACASSASWNPELLEEMGKVIGEEALAYGVDVVLGPGVNIKRNPLCGRNFEYFSEDPYLAGQLGKSWINGVQSKGVGTSLKHFAANNQEADRMMSNSMIDERALREIYLAGFETAVKEAKPETVMCSYNMINGTFSSDNKTLLTDILRDEWGFDGIVVTDWGAMNDRIRAFEAGCDLEMPSSNGIFDEEVKKAVEEGILPESAIDACVERIVKLAKKSEKVRRDYQNNGGTDQLDKDAHHELAKKIAEESAVLLKNENHILPLKKGETIALCGAMAETVRYQGAGSSHINPARLSDLKTAMENMGEKVGYYPAYELNGERNEDELEAAVAGAKEADKVVLVVGLPDSFESEGYDRKHMRIPESHQELIAKTAAVNENIVVVLMGGSPVEMPWIGNTKAILNLYLGGQAVGEAAANLLYGQVNPSGKLAETYPVCYKDCSSSDTYGVNPRQVEYAESIYVGYRYFEKAGIPVQFPFGYGQSYTTFAYSDINIGVETIDFTKDAENILTVSCKIKNTGDMAGAEIVQLYVGDCEKEGFRAVKEMKGFRKVFLNPGEEKAVVFLLARRSFAHYDVEKKNWEVKTGEYTISVGASSEDIRLQEIVNVEGTVETLPYAELPQWYQKPEGKPSVKDFESIYGQEIHPFEPEKPGNYTMMNTFNDMKENPIIQQIMEGMKAPIVAAGGGDESNPETIFTLSIIFNTPLIRLVQQCGGATPRELMELAVGSANGDVSAMEKLGAIFAQA